VILQIWEATTTERMKRRPVLSARELLRTKSTFHRCIDYVDIAGHSSARSLQSKYSGRNDDFQPLYAKIFRKR